MVSLYLLDDLLFDSCYHYYRVVFEKTMFYIDLNCFFKHYSILIITTID